MQQIGLRLEREMRLDTSTHYGRIHRLGNEVHSSRCQSTGLVRWIGTRRDKNHRNISERRVGFEPPANFNAVPCQA